MIIHKTSKYNKLTKIFYAYKGYLYLKIVRKTQDAQVKTHEKTYENTLISTYTDIRSRENRINKILLNLKVKYNFEIVVENNYMKEVAKYR